jgi:DNA-binding NarL/FixJ family response regulator
VKSLNILLVDDHEMVRLGLRMVLQPLEGIQVIGEAGTAEDAIAGCEKYQPDLVIMDIRMPGNSGIDACREIVERWPNTQVIMLTSYAEDALIVEAIQAGAVGYVLKDVGMTELMRALEAVRQGAAALDPAITRRVLGIIRERGDSGSDAFSSLTEREVEVLRLLAEGRNNGEIAETLVVSDKTVRNYVSTLLDKMKVTTRAEAANFALQHNISQYRRKEK